MTVFSKSSQQLNNIKSLQFKKSIKKEKEKHKVIQTLSWLYSIVEESMVFYTQNSESTEEENLKEKKISENSKFSLRNSRALLNWSEFQESKSNLELWFGYKIWGISIEWHLSHAEG